jgi:hypothetical protein
MTDSDSVVPLTVRLTSLMASDSEEDDSPLPTWIEGDSLAPYQGSKPETIRAVLAIADLTPQDVVYDLGCGDARIPIAAADIYNCRAVGVEKFVFDKAEKRLKSEIAGSDPARSRSLQSLVSIREEDALTCDMRDCTVCIMFLLPDGLKQINDRLESLLDRGVRLVTIFWGLKTRKPIKTANVGLTTIYYYTKESEKC